MNLKNQFLTILLWIFSLLITACSVGGITDTDTNNVIKPIADSGQDQEVLELQTVVLSAHASSDSNNKSLTYSWSLTKPGGSLTTVLSDSTAVAPTFTPDISGIYKATLTVSNGESVSLSDTTTIVVLEQLTNDPSSDGHPYYNSDGSKIAFHSTRGADGDNNIWVMDADGNNLVQITNNLASDKRPSWSPDDTQIVFHSNRNGNDDLYIKNSDGSGTSQQITSNLNNDTHPNWNPVNSTQIAYESTRDGIKQIRLKIVGQSGSSPILDSNEYDGHPMWSYDGTKIAFGRNSGTGINDIWVMNSDGTNLVQLTNTANTDEQHPDWSPDGERIAFRYIPTGAVSDVWIMNKDGSNKTQLTHDPADDRNPEWHPDGSKIIFRSNRTGNDEIFSYPLN